ncbi:MAG: ADP-ribosylglycohydrolase family protein [Lachnospiraceae bacterium]|nr:ADP-ribosylglycohydrolase family protein [Lachnospiraceae bacterium]
MKNVNNVIGAIVGDIVGSVYEFDNHRSKEFPLFSEGCFPTDDSIMTLAIAKALILSDGNYENLSELAVSSMQEVGRPYHECGYGGRFYGWMYSNNPKPYNSLGNGAAMRVSAVASVANSLEEVKILSEKVTAVTHNHPEGIKGAEATAVGAWMAMNGYDKKEIIRKLEEYYSLDFTIDEIRPTYRFNETCMETVPQAIECFKEADDFEDTIRTAISLGGDSDTLAAIAGSIAGAYYGVPGWIEEKARSFLDDRLSEILDCFAVYVVSMKFN